METKKVGIGVKGAKQLWRTSKVLFALAVIVLPSMTAAAQTGGLGGRVANPDPDNPRSQSIFIYTLEHGETKNDQLLVMNKTEEEQTITLGSVDGVVTNSGDYTCRQEAEPVEDSGGWVKLEKTQLTLPAGGEEKVNFTVTVPENADVGEHNSCLTIFQTDQEKHDDENSSGVRLRMRQAIRMVITIPGDLRRELSIENFAITYGDGEQNYSFTTGNKGNVSADVDMRVRLTTFFDREAANVGGEYPIVPGESLTKEFTTNLRPMFGGWYEATPSIRYDKRLGAFGTQNEKAEYETITGTPQTMFFWPTTVGWAIIAAVILLIIVIIWRTSSRVRRFNRIRNSSRTYTVKKGDTLQGLAEQANVSWKDLAKLNELSAPFSLAEGQRILLPGADTAVEAPSQSMSTSTFSDDDTIPDDIIPERPARRVKHAAEHHKAPHKKPAATRKTNKKG